MFWANEFQPLISANGRKFDYWRLLAFIRGLKAFLVSAPPRWG